MIIANFQLIASGASGMRASVTGLAEGGNDGDTEK